MLSKLPLEIRMEIFNEYKHNQDNIMDILSCILTCKAWYLALMDIFGNAIKKCNYTWTPFNELRFASLLSEYCKYNLSTKLLFKTYIIDISRYTQHEYNSQRGIISKELESLFTIFRYTTPDNLRFIIENGNDLSDRQLKDNEFLRLLNDQLAVGQIQKLALIGPGLFAHLNIIQSMISSNLTRLYISSLSDNVENANFDEIPKSLNDIFNLAPGLMYVHIVDCPYFTDSNLLALVKNCQNLKHLFLSTITELNGIDIWNLETRPWRNLSLIQINSEMDDTFVIPIIKECHLLTSMRFGKNLSEERNRLLEDRNFYKFTSHWLRHVKNIK